MKVLQIETWRNEFSEDECNFDEVKKYLDFVKEASKRYDPSRYSEWHHVIPRCVDINKRYREEGFRLNGRDHFLAHKLLVSCFNGKFKSKMSFALTKMLGHMKGVITPEDYEEARRINSLALQGNKNALGHTHSEEVRKRMSQNRVGLIQSEETKRKRIETLKGHEVTEETREKIRKTLTGRFQSEESKEKNRQSQLGRKHSEETKKKMSESQRGENNAMYGKHHSQESRDKMSKSRQGNQNAKGNIWITDGVNNKIIRNIDDLPDNWRRGRTIKKKEGAST